MKAPPAPTYEQIAANAKITWHDGHDTRTGFACWYPQMGGYAARCVVVLQDATPGDARGIEGATCFEAYVWHDGEFPFAEDAERSPAVIHHCSAGQFVEFGQLVQAKARERLS